MKKERKSKKATKNEQTEQFESLVDLLAEPNFDLNFELGCEIPTEPDFEEVHVEEMNAEDWVGMPAVAFEIEDDATDTEGCELDPVISDLFEKMNIEHGFDEPDELNTTIIIQSDKILKKETDTIPSTASFVSVVSVCQIEAQPSHARRHSRYPSFDSAGTASFKMPESPRKRQKKEKK